MYMSDRNFYRTNTFKALGETLILEPIKLAIVFRNKGF